MIYCFVSPDEINWNNRMKNKSYEIDMRISVRGSNYEDVKNVQLLSIKYKGNALLEI